jgi:Ca2+-binding EF-hand superfamily protein
VQGPEDEERVDPEILATWRTAEAAFMSFASAQNGFIEKEELMALMHEVRVWVCVAEVACLGCG